MSEPASKPRSGNTKSLRTSTHSMYEAEALILQSMRLIAAPDPEDDFTDEQLAAICKSEKYSSEFIRHLIECIKAI